MPRIGRTILPRIRKSLEERGVLVTLARRSFCPFHLLRVLVCARTAAGTPDQRVDQLYGVDTDGDIDGWTYLSDLNIASSNWIHGKNYGQSSPVTISALMAALPINFSELHSDILGRARKSALLASGVSVQKILGWSFVRAA
jgi:hypothetical protein